MHIPLRLCEGVEIAVRVLSMVQPQKKGRYRTINKRTNEEVTSKTRYVSEQTGQMLLKTDMKFKAAYGEEAVSGAGRGRGGVIAVPHSPACFPKGCV